MSQPCPNCGSLNLANHRFCSNCGSALPTQASAPPSGRAVTSPEGDSAPPTNTASTMPFSASYAVKTSEPEPSYFDPQAPTAPINTTEQRPAYYSPTPPPPPPGIPSPPNTGYQGYAPGASARKDGGFYAPYTTSSATALEKPRESRSWLVPVVVVAALVLLGLAAASAYIVMNNPATDAPTQAGVPRTTTPGEQIPIPEAITTPSIRTTPLPPNATAEDRVREAIMRSNENQIRAWRELKEEAVREDYTGTALQEQLVMLKDLRDKNLYAIPVNQRLDILSIKITGDKATVNTLEVWTVTFFEKATNKRVDSKGPSTWAETYSLVKKDGRWLIESLTFDAQQGASEEN